MATAPSPFPDLRNLTLGLRALMKNNGAKDSAVTVLKRQSNIYESTFPSEIVTCRLADGTTRKLFCKYGWPGHHSSSNNGHHGGIAYESKVYRYVLHRLETSKPRFYGARTDRKMEQKWLVIEYLDRCQRLQKRPAAMKLAARWIGRFHAVNADRLARVPLSSLIVYDAPYYAGWVRQTSRLAGVMHHRLPWLATLCERAEEWIALLLKPPLTVIHGEYYPLNILLRARMVYPVDWESAAIAAGEIDLASLTEGWRARIVRECVQEYQQARWPKGPPADFERKLTAARLYLAFRWLADGPDYTTDDEAQWYFEQMRSLGERLGLI